MCRSAAYTLMEMLIALAVIGVLAALAVPAFGNLRQDAERTAVVNSFFHALFLARSEAVRRGQVVSVCKSTDLEQCANDAPDWNVGWIVFVNDDREQPPERDPGEALLQVYPVWKGGQITSNRPAFSFRPFRQGTVNGTIVFCDRRGAEHARAIIISHTGRPRVAQRDAGNKALRCESG